MYVNTGSGEEGILFWGLSPSDNNQQINTYKAQNGITHPCAGTEGGGPAAKDVVIAGQNFLGYPTYCVVCPDRTLYFDICWPPTEQCFYPYFDMCTPPIMAGFSASDYDICEGLEVQFTDESTGDITSWEWTFEGGTPETSTEENPTVMYTAPGEYDVSLTVSDGTNSNTISSEDIMLVFALPQVTIPANDTACIEWEPFALTSGMPEGGEYSGTGVESGMFDPEVAGMGMHIITYSYTDDNGCENEAQQQMYVTSCVGMEEISSELLEVFPNPASGKFFVKTGAEGVYRLQLMSIGGQLVYETTIEESAEIVLPELGYGIYLLKIFNENYNFVRKLSITRE
ncbi:MAG: PKD domain-containing protein [Bacteroidales bacterium]